MIRFFLLQNRAGKTRLSKWYTYNYFMHSTAGSWSELPCCDRYSPFDEDERRKIESEVHRNVTSREAKLCNFIEAKRKPVGLPPPGAWANADWVAVSFLQAHLSAIRGAFLHHLL